MRVLVIVTTYNRPAFFLGLMDQLAAVHQVTPLTEVRVYDDGSFPRYPSMPMQEHAWALPWTFCVMRHHGKERYWALMQAIWQDLRGLPWDLCVQLPDDITFAPRMLADALALWQALDDPQAMTLNLLRDVGRAGRPQWTGVMPSRRQLRTGAWVEQTQWVDMCYLAPRRMCEALAWRVEPVLPRLWGQGMHSSGVGRQLSWRLHQAGSHLYQVSETLVHHGLHESVMHPEHRREVPLYA